MRLIDAEALKRNMEFVCMGIMAGTEDYNAPLTEIDNAPTVEERPKGKWIVEHDRVHCFPCGHEQNYPSNFCPNCGADMRKGDET